jgi:hypothetical protein
VLKFPIRRMLIGGATAFIAGLLLLTAVASAADNAPISRTQFKRECERQGGTFTEGKNSEGKTVWVCVKSGKVIADCELDEKGYGGCTFPRDWQNKTDGSSSAGSDSRPLRTGPAQYIDEGAVFQSSSAADGTGPRDIGLPQHTDRAPASP